MPVILRLQTRALSNTTNFKENAPSSPDCAASSPDSFNLLLEYTY